jgi:hypothetical protein
MSDMQQKQYDRARTELLEKEHDLTTRAGILDWLAAVGMALTHDVPEMPRQKANTSAYVAAVSLKAIQS